MVISNCRGCGTRITVDTNIDVPLCKNCEQLYFSKIKTYINKNGTSIAANISRELRIPISIINRFVEDGRLFTPEQQANLKEEMATINRKRQKEEENKKVLQMLVDSMEKSDVKENEVNHKMRFIDPENKQNRR